MDVLQQNDEGNLRGLMFSIAYHMTGSVAEAEDLVQEGFFRLERARQSGVVVESPKAYLAAATTRLAIDHMRSARVRRESYVGTWLPEPIVADLHESPEQMAELSDSLSMAFLVLLESLSPVERAVFLLREIFDYSYEDIAQIVDRSQANCRQIFKRARQHLDAPNPASTHRPNRAKPCSGLFSLLSVPATSTNWWNCWRPTLSSVATGVARRPRSVSLSTGAIGSPRSSSESTTGYCQRG
jgi:RNA polymerase sigma-70 factor (ECF subfamily)